MLSEKPPFREKPVTLIHHAAHCGHDAPPNSLSAIQTCFEAGAAVVEIDVIPLADGSFALLHDQDLEADTDGQGQATRMSRDQIKDLHYVVAGKATTEPVGFLDEALDLLSEYPDVSRLQLDLKPYAPLTQSVLREFLDLLVPCSEQVQVTSVADWAVRSLAKSMPDLALGFDPLLYLDIVVDEPRSEQIPPFRIGAYGFLDDHPLSAYQWGPLGDYFAARAAALLVQVPAGCEWFIRAELLGLALDAGFDWIDFLHQHGSRVDGWTIDVDQPQQVSLAKVMVEHGIDALTTDTPARLAEKLPSATIV